MLFIASFMFMLCVLKLWLTIKAYFETKNIRKELIPYYKSQWLIIIIFLTSAGCELWREESEAPSSSPSSRGQGLEGISDHDAWFTNLPYWFVIIFKVCGILFWDS